MNDTFGFRLRFYRTNLGFTQQQLAEKSGVSRKQISDFEKGIQKNPRPQTLFKLANALGISFTDLQTDADLKLTDAESLAQNRSVEFKLELPVDVIKFYKKLAEENGTSIDDELYLAVKRQLNNDKDNLKNKHREGLDSEILERLNKLEQDLQSILSQKNQEK
ncbi:helix-turn-helix domain-containing protein [Acinetobacter indicus]|uniref:helix-turn-helix domain-containing protein n=1 Tax=Acinetobacter indicus TaxID=756892 RepID=UPI00144488AC|nr:helix-turn-helix domain-containing protein [Acinetobacter indicus]